MNLQIFTFPAIMPVPVLAALSPPGPAAPEAGCAGLFEGLCPMPSPVVEVSVAALRLPVAALGVDDAIAMVATLNRSAALLPGPPVRVPCEPSVQTPHRIATPVPPAPESRLPTQFTDEARSPTVETVPHAQPMPSSVFLRTPERSLVPGGECATEKPTKMDSEIAAPFHRDETPAPDTSAMVPPVLPPLPVMSAALLSLSAATPPPFTPAAGFVSANAPGVSSDAKQKAVVAPSATTPDNAPIIATANSVAIQPVTDFAVLLASSILPETAAVDRHLDLARGDAWIDDLARDIAASGVRGGHLKFALAPETLGRLDVEVRRGGDGLSIHMAARNETARDVLSAAQSRLIEEIRAQGVRVVGSDVSTGNADTRGDRTARPPLPPSIEASLAVAEAETPKFATSGRYA